MSKSDPKKPDAFDLDEFFGSDLQFHGQQVVSMTKMAELININTQSIRTLTEIVKVQQRMIKELVEGGK